MKPLVIGASLGRTGTYSLKLALERLGYFPCLHMSDFAADADLCRLWLDELEKPQPDWQKLLSGYKAVVDWPACKYLEQLMGEFPDAQVVFTERKFESWYDSVGQTILPALKWSKNISQHKRSPFVALAHNEVLVNTFAGESGRAYLAQIYAQHRERVSSLIPADQLLYFELAQGWRPLCEFLQCQILDEDFPRSNSSENFIHTLRRNRKLNAAH